MTETASHMAREIAEIPAAAGRLLAAQSAILERAGAALRDRDPALVGTIARGSSDHAAAFLKYAIEITMGVPVASIGPSVTTIYGRRLRLERAATIAISQSGRSPDIVDSTSAARRAGALTLALTNAPGAPLAEAADIAIDLVAGLEQSVAATKSFTSSIVAGLGVLAHWSDDRELRGALATIPAALEQGQGRDWTAFADAIAGHKSLYVLGRGPTLAIASEAALKLKETCGIHAEAYSAAEVLHGPARIVEAGFPVLALAARDSAESAIAETADRLAEQGAVVFATTDLVTRANRLPGIDLPHPLVNALALIVPFYRMAESLSRRLGFDPDRPPHLNKVTRTV